MMQTVMPFTMMALCSPTKMNVLHHRARHPHPMKLEMHRRLTRYFKGESERGRLRPIDSDVLARTFIGAICQYVMMEHMERSADLPTVAPPFIRGMVDVLLHGARPVRAVRRSSRRR